MSSTSAGFSARLEDQCGEHGVNEFWREARLKLFSYAVAALSTFHTIQKRISFLLNVHARARSESDRLASFHGGAAILDALKLLWRLAPSCGDCTSHLSA